MSDQGDDILQLYSAESLDHLADIERDLLEIEAAGAGADGELVNKVFRAAHSIKGGAGFLGLSVVSALAHRLENVLGLVRSRELVPTADVVGLLLQGFDRLRAFMLDLGASNDADVAELVVALDSLTTVVLPPDRRETVATRLQVFADPRGPSFTVSEFELAQARKGGRLLYLLDYDLIHDIHRRGRRPLDVLGELEGGGVIVDCRLDLAAAGTLAAPHLPTRLPLLVLYATVIEPDIAPDVFDLPPERVHRIGPEGLRPLAAGGAPPAPPPPPPPPPAAKASASPRSETSLRVSVGLLDTLMDLAGELVLSRNQLLQALVGTQGRVPEAVAQRIDGITSRLQEAIMLTRMQPVGQLFQKFPRLVRDLARSLGKEVELVLEGAEVELDKTILEGLSDPLTHLVRNAVDHGIEAPDLRRAAGKPAQGRVLLRAHHEGGHVHLEVADDGRGIDPDQIAAAAVAKGLLSPDQAQALSASDKTALILLPGFSTATRVTDVSGRGVGMDVVKTNLDKLGGSVAIASRPGAGSTIRVKLPLTLAIIPSHLVTAGGQPFAIPQVNLDELLRIPAAAVAQQVERVGDAEVVRLRGQLLPLVRLADVLGLTPRFRDGVTGAEHRDQRRAVADRRSRRSNAEGIPEPSPAAPEEPLRSGQERRHGAVHVVVASAGAFRYGLVVDELLDAEEIVVKPLGRQLKHLACYAGTTVMGDGRVALILDLPGIAREARLSSVEETPRAAEVAREACPEGGESLLVFHSGRAERLAIPLDLVVRIERVTADAIRRVGGRPVLPYHGGTLPLLTVHEVAPVPPVDEARELVVLVVSLPGRQVGLLANAPVDAYREQAAIDRATLAGPGVAGSILLDGAPVLVVDVTAIARRCYPEWYPLAPGDGQPSSFQKGDQTR